MKNFIKQLQRLQEKIKYPCRTYIYLDKLGLNLSSEIYIKQYDINISSHECFSYHEIQEVVNEEILIDSYIETTNLLFEQKLKELTEHPPGRMYG